MKFSVLMSIYYKKKPTWLKVDYNLVGILIKLQTGFIQCRPELVIILMTECKSVLVPIYEILVNLTCIYRTPVNSEHISWSK
jgi:hypothetical protein